MGKRADTGKAKDAEKRISLTNSVKTKLIAIMLVLTAVPLLLLTVISYRSTMSKSVKDAQEINEKQLEIISGHISDLINQNIQAIVTMANSPESRVFTRMSGKYRDVKRFHVYLESVDESLADGNSTVITNAEGEQLARSTGKLVNTSDREYFTHAMNGEIYISDTIVSKTTGSLIVVPVAPVYDDDHAVVQGFVQRNFDLNVLHNMLASEAGSDQVIVITDRKGKVIAHSQHEINADTPEDDRSGEEYFKTAAAGTKATTTNMINGKKYIVSSMQEPATGWIIINEREYDAALAPARRSATLQVLIGIIALAVVVVIAFLLANSFSRPIVAVNHSLDRLSNGEFEKVTNPKFTKRKDEFGQMIHETNSVIDRLDQIVRNIKESASSVGESSDELAETTGQISQTADDVSNAVQEIATGATQQAEEIQNATESTGKISENIQDVSNSATGLENVANDMRDGSRDSVTQLEKLRASSDQMKEAIDEISKKIGATSQAVENINSKVAVITSIASQTNLLALNASIEAARAGDAGKGFAVVAEEIGKLADNSAVSASEIRNEMEVLLSESQAAVEQADSVRNTTEEQAQILEATVQSVNKLIDNIQTTVDGVQSINQAAELCTSSKSVVVDAMSSLSAISEENAAASQETGASMQELGATITTLSTAADQLRGIAARLNEEIAFFK